VSPAQRGAHCLTAGLTCATLKAENKRKGYK